MAISFTVIWHFLVALLCFALLAGALWYVLNAVLAFLPPPAARFANLIRAFVYLLLVLFFIGFITGNVGGFRL